ncbi:MAG: M23 family metallopeptidase, partial [Proteobacteria bacterium]|nr:M23 family metallopeptidase [Pseudomonadota bacterium]
LATLYAHLDNRGMPPVVKEGQVVRRGQVLGYIGMTGLTSGPHVHFEVLVNDQPINPRKYLPSSMG